MKRKRPKTWEEKLVYYANKRVMQDKIVPLEKRLEEAHRKNAYLHETRAQSKANSAKVDPLIYRLEKEIFNKIGSDPVEVTNESVGSYSRKTSYRESRIK